MGCCALLGSEGVHRAHHVCPLLPQLKPSWRVFAVFAVSGPLQCWEVHFTRHCTTFHVLHWADPTYCWQGASSSSERKAHLLCIQAKLARRPRKVRFPAVVFCGVTHVSIFCTSSSMIIALIPVTIKEEILVLGIRMKWSAPLCPHQYAFPRSSASVTQHSLLQSQSLWVSEGP